MRIGAVMKLYRNTGTYGTPVWALITLTKDVKLSNKKGEADASTRGFSGYGADAGTLKKFTATFGTLYDISDTQVAALQAAYLAAPPITPTEFAFADGAIATTGTNWFRAGMEVMGMERDEGIDKVVYIDWDVKTTVSANAPAFTTT